jgi:Ulp1 family protease
MSHHKSFINSDVFTLKFDTYINDNILNYVIKSLKDKLGLTDAPVAFFNSFFFTKLCRHGHEDPALENKYCYAEVAGWTRKTFQTRSIDKMKTIVFFRNQTLSHWIYYAIFLDLRIIQAFDSMGGNHPSDLKALYCWFHETMMIARKKLNPAEWCLYGTRPGTPKQLYADCGLYTVLFRLCVAKRYFLRIINRERITAACCLLLLKLINLDPKKAKPLLHGPIDRKFKSWVLHPFHYLGESLPYFDEPFSTFLKYAMKNRNQSPPDGSNGSGTDHNC